MIPQVKPWLGAEEREAVARCIDDEWLTEGPRCKEFAARLCALIGSPYGVFAPNGTLALALGLLALGIGQGDEVIVPDSTFIGSANAVLLTGAKPVFVDVEPDHFQIDVKKIEAALTFRTKAIMPVHLFGTAADMDAIMAIARRHCLKVIEDAAQGIGVHYDKHHVGGISDVGCFSFYADKTITTGEGGFIACHDPEIYERLLLLRNQGRLHSGTFVHPVVGWNFRITDMQAALGLCQLDRLKEIIARKKAILAIYRLQLADVQQVSILRAAPKANMVPFRCVLMCDEADKLSEHLQAHDIQTRGFFYPMHKQPCFAGVLPPQDDKEFPVSVRAHARGICLPIYPTMEPAQVMSIAETIRGFYGIG